MKQTCTMASVEFDDASVADFIESQVEQGRKPEQCCRIWVHTHPGNSPQPSGHDEQTFSRVFGRNPWAVMLIVAMDNSAYARLRFNVGPGEEVEIPVKVDYSKPFLGSDHEGWDAEYVENVDTPKWDNMGFHTGIQNYGIAGVTGPTAQPGSYYTREDRCSPRSERSFMDEAWEEYTLQHEQGFRDEVNGVPEEFLVHQQVSNDFWDDIEVQKEKNDALDEAALV